MKLFENRHWIKEEAKRIASKMMQKVKLDLTNKNR